MAGRLETSIWNLTFVAAAAACGPTIPIDDDGGEGDGPSSSDEGIESDTHDDSTTSPCVSGGCDRPECYSDSDCGDYEYCDDFGFCQPGGYCAGLPGDDVFRCEYYECFEDFECAPDEHCEFYSCVPDGCDPEAAFGISYLIGEPDGGPIVDLAFVDIDGAPPQELAIATSTRIVLASSFSPAFTQIAVGEDLVSLDAGDVDGDGDLDIVAAQRGQGGQLVVVTNEAGAFTPLGNIASPGVPIEILLGDPENDGSADAFVRTETGIVRHVDLGEQSPLVGSFAPAMALAGWSLAYASAEQSWWLPVATLEPAEPAVLWDSEMRSLATARLDADTDPDVFGVVLTNGLTRLVAWRGPIATPAGDVSLDAEYPRVVAVDVNGDGVSEPVVVADTVAIVLSTSSDSEQAYGCTSEILLSHAPIALAAGDWDGDAGEELMIADGGGLTLLDRDDDKGE